METFAEYDCVRGYSMSQDEQDATIGRVMRERKELTQKVTLLTAKAAKQGSFLKGLGSALETAPDRVAFQGASSGANSMSNVRWFEVALYPQFQDIVTVGNELREAIALLQRKQEEANRLGI